ncbi:cysteinyl-tRNA synthetase [Buchnera aphidicola (Cinara tujafilina)]|uniref:Cysteine--tRNA ligase n=1 Tax=Buchnera aphidicola (Cinara tujafilina) TaxID=261317 RepID=F7WZL9_9GAMM|nr:cysteine--tRNA ligase [Buchnera aphidicola]AEH39886.1 cysteinyl-tRNA synthetase [Buchnera aphidicola (Cinara tujafilina)]
MLKIFNTLTKMKEKFFFSYKKIINIYVCGVTTYDFCHIGHARTFLIFDMLIRYLQNIGYVTNYVRNITDIDDKIINRAINNNESVKNFSLRMISEMKKDFFSLGLLEPNYEPKVTESITDIISIIKKLINNKYAYIEKNGDVLFSIKNCSKYGKLSRRLINIHDKKNTDFKKNNVFIKDFVLWKNFLLKKQTDKKDSVFWDSPWGLGRPGWHIECSAIHQRYCLDGVDIHGGGIDLLFPHHENELAQSCCINSDFPIHFWMHTGMVILNNKKVSKSLNNFITIRSLLLKYHPEVIRYYFLSTHYRHPLYYNENNLIISQKILNRIYTVISDNYLILLTDVLDFKDKKIRNNFKKKFYNAMNDDFNTPKVCSLLYDLSRYINMIYKNNRILARALVSDLIYFGNILGLLKTNPEKFLFQNPSIYSKKMNFINKLIKLRMYYRDIKKWELADKIRNKLLNLGVKIQDTKNNSIYRFL